MQGASHTSTANLSSLWATTKYSATYNESEDEESSQDDHDLLMKEMSEIQYEKTLTYVQTVGRESEATDKTDLMSLKSDDVGDTSTMMNETLLGCIDGCLDNSCGSEIKELDEINNQL